MANFIEQIKQRQQQEVDSKLNASQPRAPQQSAMKLPNVQLQGTDASNDLRGQTISRDPTQDREALANQYTDNWIKSSEPYYQRDLRQATTRGAAQGKLGSGELRTSLGDLAINRGVQADTMRSNFLTNALEGSINDQFRDVANAQQQQAYQTGLQNQTFNQDLQRFQAGGSGDLYNTQLDQANNAANRASGYSDSLSDLIGSTTAGNAQSAENEKLRKELEALRGGVPPAERVLPSSGGIYV